MSLQGYVEYFQWKDDFTVECVEDLHHMHGVDVPYAINLAQCELAMQFTHLLRTQDHETTLDSWWARKVENKIE